MLVTNPQMRASLPDLLNHPWMTRGFNGPPDPHLLRREPLRADELDRQVIRNMTGFEFGTEDEIERRLITILESESYRRAVQYWENKRERPRIWNDSLSNSSLAIAWDGASSMIGHGGGNKPDVPSTPKKNKRFSGFDFYRRKLFSSTTSPPSSPFASPSPSQSQLSNASLSDINQKEPPDPTRGYHQLISIYYLAREKMERDRVYGVGHFASSQLSVNPPQPTPEEAPPPSASKQSAQLTVSTPSATPQKAVGGADYNMRPSRLPAPESLHYSKMSYDGPVSPSPTTATFQQRQQQQPQPRARDAGLPVQKHVDISPPSPIAVPGGPDPAAAAAAPTSATLPRAPPASTHRRSHSVSQRPGVPRGLASMFGGGAGGATGVNEHGQLRVNVNSNINGHERPRTAGPELTTFAERMEDEQAAATSETPDSPPPEVILMPATPTSAGATLVRRFGNLLAGGGSVRGSGDRASKRTSILGSFGSPRPSADVDHSEKEKERERERRQASSPSNEKTERASTSAPTSPSPGADAVPTAENDGHVDMQVTPTGGISHSQTQPLHRRAATILDPQGHAKRHERRSSTGGALLSTVGGTIGRHRRPSTSHPVGRPSQLERPFAQTTEVPEEDALGRPSGQGRVNGAGPGYELTDGEDETNANAADKDFKPVFLKGLFRCATEHSFCPADNDYVSWISAFDHYSVATTSTKSPAVLKTDIRRVLDRMQVQYRETKTGFDCIHLPSIDISSLQDPHGTPTPSPKKHRKQNSAGSGDSGSATRRIVRKASKLSFGVGRKDKDKDHRSSEATVNGNTHNKEKEKEKELPSRPSGGGSSGGPAFGATQSSGSSSFFNVSSGAPTVHADDVSATLHPDELPRRSHSPTRSKNLPPIPHDFGGAATPRQHQVSGPTGDVADREAFESVGQNTFSVRFEINIVKVRDFCFFPFLFVPGPYLLVLTPWLFDLVLMLISFFFFLALFRSPGCRYTVFNSVARVETDGSTRCSHVES